MPPLQKRFLGKGPFLRAIDDLWRSLDLGQKRGVLASLEATSGGDQGLLQLANSLGIGSAGDLDHIAHDWFDNWWSEWQPIEPVLRMGLTQALRLALHDPETGAPRTHPLPIESLWLSGVERVEVGISASEHQITMLLFTPPVPDAGAVAGTDLDPVWMVHRGEPRDGEHGLHSASGLVVTRVLARTA